MLAREHRVGDAVDDERPGSDRRQGLRRSFAVGHEVVVLHRGEVARPLNVATKRLNSAVGGGRSRSPGVTGEVLIRVRESTLSAESSATSWAIPPPAETPTRCAAEMPKPSSTPTASAVRSEERRVGKECRSRWSPY